MREELRRCRNGIMRIEDGRVGARTHLSAKERKDGESTWRSAASVLLATKTMGKDGCCCRA
jgi:hypothetical protein